MGYTTKTCPKCSKNNQVNASRDNNKKRPDKSDQKRHEKKPFAQVKEKPMAKSKKNQKAPEESAELGFMQLGTVGRDSTIGYSFINICKVDSPSKT